MCPSRKSTLSLNSLFICHTQQPLIPYCPDENKEEILKKLWKIQIILETLNVASASTRGGVQDCLDSMLPLRTEVFAMTWPNVRTDVMEGGQKNLPLIKASYYHLIKAVSFCSEKGKHSSFYSQTYSQKITITLTSRAPCPLALRKNSGGRILQEDKDKKTNPFHFLPKDCVRSFFLIRWVRLVAHTCAPNRLWSRWHSMNTIHSTSCFIFVW